ncbi:hypothetical protein [Streptomyces sp. ST2-7A]|uniref:hypothetical protein n=1 Tax=Streptomyces sp. ST2-7A TaxID=2907214 RepID=UPI001F2868B1|nr:hypothetical protein [Streptomyces sp. ST2-7A]MCE7078999.1 hypothetical protein [Streptomyces sp. ST2-7A]
MLRLPRTEAPPGTGHYWCEVAAHTTGHHREYPLGSYHAPSPRLAMKWLHGRAGHIADQLDPGPRTPVRAWLNDTTEHEYALATLVAGGVYTHTIRDGTTRYQLAALPTARLFIPRTQVTP